MGPLYPYQPALMRELKSDVTSIVVDVAHPPTQSTSSATVYGYLGTNYTVRHTFSFYFSCFLLIILITACMLATKQFDIHDQEKKSNIYDYERFVSHIFKVAEATNIRHICGAPNDCLGINDE
uniref:Uncharacterized protein n=1 Tax=Glossina brevipalpis TaxID=37001 RepID=A0A1A9WQE3_9MUSC